MSLPDPLVPADCDLTGHDWFPMYFRKLQQSEWWLSASDLARSRNVDLWAEAYAQVPAGSLPDNDVVLARFAGYGRNLADFRAVKEELLAAWVLCSDGRWYHPMLCRVAAVAWAGRQEALAAKEADRLRKQAKRAEEKGVHGASAGQGADVRRTSGGNPAEIALKGEERKGKNPPKAPQGDEGEGTDQDRLFEQLVDAWASAVGKGRAAIPKARAEFDRLPPDVQARLAAAAPRFAAARPWGTNGPPHLQAWLRDGRYRDFLDAEAGAQVIPLVWAGPPEVRQAVVDDKRYGEDFARSYLDPAGWEEGPPARILPRNRVAGEALAQCRALDPFGCEIERKAA